MTYTREQILNAISGRARPEVYTDEMRDKILSTLYFEKALSDLKEKFDEELSTVLPHQHFSLFRIFEEKGSRQEFYSTYAAVRRRLVIASIVAWLYEDKRALTMAEDALWLILNEYSWAPPFHITTGTTEADKRNVSLDVVMNEDTYVIDLQAAECAATVSECILMLGGKMHPLLVKRALSELERRIFNPFLTHSFAWETKKNNWASVCGSNVCIAALGVIDDDEHLTDVLYKAFGSLERYLSGFSEDGACLEGLGYWNYGFGPYVGLAKLLLDRTGGEIDLFADPIVERVARFYSKCFFAGKRTVSFSDGSTTAPFIAATHSILLDRFPDLVIPSEFIDLGLVLDSRLQDVVRLFTETTENFVNSDGKLFGTHILPVAEWYISSSENGVGIAAKGGCNAEPHNHNDVGSFQIYKNGSEIVSDLGCGEYTKSYFSSERYECFTPSSRSHSVPIINGEYQKNGESYRARNTVITEDGITADIAGAYSIEALDSLERCIKFDKKSGRVSVKDTYKFKRAPSSITERIVTSASARIEGDSVVIENGEERMYVTFDPDKLSVSLGRVDDRDRHGLPRVTTVIDLTVKAPQETFTAEYVIDNERI